MPTLRSDDADENGRDDWHLREMSTADISQVLAIEQLNYPQPWSIELFKRELDNPFAYLLVCAMNKTVLGYVCFWAIAGEVEIHNVASHPEHQGCGVGSALMGAVFDFIDRHDVHSAFLEVRCGNDSAIHLYEKFAFKSTSTRKQYYADGEDALLMEWRRH